MEKKYDCLNCGSQNHTVIARESYRGNNYAISHCQSCNLVFTSFQSHDANQGYLGHTRETFFKKYGAIIEGKILHDRDQNYMEEVKLISEFVQSGNYLDVGCNAGWLLGYLKKHTSLNLHGLEPSPMLASICQEVVGAKVFNAYVEPNILPQNHFQFVSMTDVFEHLPNPNQVLSVLSKAIAPNGYLMIKVPNGSFTLLKYRLSQFFPFLVRESDQFNAKEHLGHYTVSLLTEILTKNNFTVKRVHRPLPIQTRGSSQFILTMRALVYRLSQFNIIPAQDILVIAQKNGG